MLPDRHIYMLQEAAAARRENDMIDFRHITTEAVRREIRRRYHTVSALFRRTLTGVLGAVVVLGVAACGGNTGMPLTEGDVDRIIGPLITDVTEETVQDLATGDLSGLLSDLELVPSATGNLSADLSSSQIISGCTPDVSGSGPDTDADNDGIPRERIETYTASNCPLAGEIRITDKDDSDPLSGYTLSTREPFRSVEGEGVTGTEINIDATRNGDTFDVLFDSEANFQFDDSTVSERADLDISLDAANAERTEGEMSYDGSYLLAFDDERFDLRFTSNDLYYDESCLTGFRRGSVTVDDGYGNTVTATYNCDEEPSVSTSF